MSTAPPAVARETLRVVVPGEPCAQGRPKFARMGKFVRAYDPKKSRNWKAMAVEFIKATAASDAIVFPDGPLRVMVTAVFTCPRGDHRKTPVARRLHPKRPDAENVAKAVLDSGTAAGIWQDDSQVAILLVQKWIGAQGEAPYVAMEVARA